MKTVAKIDPEKEYENACKLIEQAGLEKLDKVNLGSLGSSVDNLITAARVLMDREERRRGQRKPPKQAKPKGRKEGQDRNKVNKLPSERYPNAEIEEKITQPDTPPICPCCKNKMNESGLFDVSEKLEVIPKQYFIVRNKRPKYSCSKCRSMVNTPALSSIIPTSNYGDSLIIDVTLSKFCDLLPMERYVQIAFRDGVGELPPQSLIGLTHQLGKFLKPVYTAIKKEILASRILMADETPHKMLEGDDTKNWYLWGFFAVTGCYFQAKNTRSGDVAKEFLKESKAKYLLSDGYSGYKRAIRLLKEEEDEKDRKEIIEAYCNAHAFRYFRDAGNTWVEECEPFLVLYGKIYDLETQRKNNKSELSSGQQLEIRQKMIPYFQELKAKCQANQADAMPESGFKKALTYFLNHYNGLIVCTDNIQIPLDNNLSEREIRSPVIGRKTWFGTHSKLGAKTAATHFSIVQTCKLNNINPRKYYPWVVNCLLNNKKVLTPYEYSKKNPPPSVKRSG